MLIAARYRVRTWTRAHWTPSSSLNGHRGSSGPCQWNRNHPHRCLFELHARRKVNIKSADLQLDSIAVAFEDKNKEWHVTSQDLIEALGTVGQEYATPAEYANQVNLSFTSAYSSVQNYDAAHRDAKINAAAAQLQPYKIYLKGVLVDHIKSLDASLGTQDGSQISSAAYDHAVANSLPRKTWRWLGKRGWGVEDLMSWTWILKASNADLAAARFWMIASKRIGTDAWHVPNTIFLFLLRRQHFSARGVRYLLKYAWKMMEHMSKLWFNLRESGTVIAGLQTSGDDPRDVPHPEEHPAGMREEMFVMIIIRLLRRARDVLPEACESIMSLFCRYMNGSNFNKTTADPARLAFSYNAMLSLLAVPMSVGPFVNSANQQRAQFTILHRMNDFEPPLVVDRRGYRAVTRVQLKHKKTLREREWAMVKSPSWPPWKEGKLGIHEDITPDYGFSRAARTLEDARSAGYKHDAWSDSASILAGWDTDGTPTIQTRRDLQWRRADTEPQSGPAKTCAHRIRATRSPRESWAIFQRSRNEEGFVPNQSRALYRAMFEKLVWASQLKHRNDGFIATALESTDVLPGDGPELSPDPHINAVSVSTPIPTFEGFYDLMLEDGVKLQTDLLSYLISQSPSLPMLAKILKDSDQSSDTVGVLIGSHDVAHIENLIDSIPRREFESIILALSRLSKQSNPLDEPASNRDEKPAILQDPFAHALHLICAKKLRHPKCWVSLLEATSHRLPSARQEGSADVDNRTQTLIAWQTVLKILGYMERFGVTPRVDTVNEVSKALEWAIIKAEEVLALEYSHDLPRLRLATKIVEKGLPILKTLFIDAVGADLRQREVPDNLQDLAESVDGEVQNELLVEEQKADQEMQAQEATETIQPSLSTELDYTIDSPAQHSEDAHQDHETDKSYLPPSCLLPRLLSVPHPALLHRFIRICGLLRDYQALLDILDWMAVFSHELKSRADEQRNGAVMMRRCIVATRVFLERSWDYYDIPERHKHVMLERDLEPAPKEIWEMAKAIVKENPVWGEWARDEEVEEYVLKGTFL